MAAPEELSIRDKLKLFENKIAAHNLNSAPKVKSPTGIFKAETARQTAAKRKELVSTRQTHASANEPQMPQHASGWNHAGSPATYRERNTNTLEACRDVQAPLFTKEANADAARNNAQEVPRQTKPVHVNAHLNDLQQVGPRQQIFADAAATRPPVPVPLPRRSNPAVQHEKDGPGQNNLGPSYRQGTLPGAGADMNPSQPTPSLLHQQARSRRSVALPSEKCLQLPMSKWASLERLDEEREPSLPAEQLQVRKIRGESHKLKALKRADWLKDMHYVHPTFSNTDVCFTGNEEDCQRAVARCTTFLVNLLESRLLLSAAAAAILDFSKRGKAFMKRRLEKYPCCGYFIVEDVKSRHWYIVCAADRAETADRFLLDVQAGFKTQQIVVPLTRLTEKRYRELEQKLQTIFSVKVDVEHQQTKHSTHSCTVSITGLVEDVDSAVPELQKFAQENRVETRCYDFHPDEERAIESWKCLRSFRRHLKLAWYPMEHSCQLCVTCHNSDLAALEKYMAQLRNTLGNSAVYEDMCETLGAMDASLLIEGLKSVNLQILAKSIEEEMKVIDILQPLLTLRIQEQEFSVFDPTKLTPRERQDIYDRLVLTTRGATDVEADVIVCHVDTSLDMKKSAVGNAIVNKLGGIPQPSPADISGGPFRVVATDVRMCGQRSLKVVQRAVLQKCSPELYRKRLYSVVLECLQQADANEMTSIVFPPLGFGNLFDYHIEIVAAQMVLAALNFLSKNFATTTLKKVVFSAKNDEGVLDVFRHELSRRKNGQTGHQADAANSDCKATAVLYLRDPKHRETALDLVRQHIHAKFLFTKPVGLWEDVCCLDDQTTRQIQSWPGLCTSVIEDGSGQSYLEAVGQPVHVLELEAFIQREVNIIRRGELQARTPQQRTVPPPPPLNNKTDEEKLRPLPSYWQNRIPDGDLYQFVEMTDRRTVDELQTILNLSIHYGARHPNAARQTVKILQVRRLENPSLWTKYESERDQLLKRPRPRRIAEVAESEVLISVAARSTFLLNHIFAEINEEYLVHGYKPDMDAPIAKQGLDPRLAADGAHGRAVYFADTVAKADAYTGRGDTRHILLARVLLGQPHVVKDRQKFQRPPCPQCLKETCHCPVTPCDSVIVCCLGEYREFVVYDSSHCYPEYFITYTNVES